MTSAIWLIDEYAISDFRSVWRRQVELVMIMPQRESMRNGYAICSVRGLSMDVIRSIP